MLRLATKSSSLSLFNASRCWQLRRILLPAPRAWKTVLRPWLSDLDLVLRLLELGIPLYGLDSDPRLWNPDLWTRFRPGDSKFGCRSLEFGFTVCRWLFRAWNPVLRTGVWFGSLGLVLGPAAELPAVRPPLPPAISPTAVSNPEIRRARSPSSLPAPPTPPTAPALSRKGSAPTAADSGRCSDGSRRRSGSVLGGDRAARAWWNARSSPRLHGTRSTHLDGRERPLPGRGSGPPPDSARDAATGSQDRMVTLRRL